MAAVKVSIWRSKYIIAVGIVLAVAGAWYFSNGAEKAATSFKVTTVEKGEIFRAVAASGAVNAVIEVEVGSQISGQIKELYVDFNDEVTKGELVALIDPEIYEMRMRQREAELAISRAERQSKAAQLSSDQASLLFADKDLARKVKLFKQGNVSSAMIESAETEKQKAKDRVRMSVANIANSEANIQQRQAALEQAKVELARTQIRAPIDGVVIERQVDVGQTVAASMQAPTLFRIANDLRDIRVEASVDEADIGQVKSGQPVSFTVDAYPDRQFNGDVEVVRLAPTIAQNVVTYTVTILASNADMALLPGMTANIEIVTGSREGVLRVPNEAIRFKPRGQPADTRGSGSFDAASMAGRIVKSYTERLALTSAQQGDLRSSIEEVLKSSMPAGNGDGASQGDAMRVAMQKMRARVGKVIKDIGTPEQIAAYEQMGNESSHRGGNRGGKRAVLWSVGEDNVPVSHQVRLGLSDNGYTEILRGLNLGDQVITGYERRRNQ